MSVSVSVSATSPRLALCVCAAELDWTGLNWNDLLVKSDSLLIIFVRLDFSSRVFRSLAASPPPPSTDQTDGAARLHGLSACPIYSPSPTGHRSNHPQGSTLLNPASTSFLYYYY